MGVDMEKDRLSRKDSEGSRPFKGLRAGCASILDVLFLLSIFVLVTGGGAHLWRSLILSGVLYWATALLYRLPLPVQPLKVFAFICLCLHPTNTEITLSSLVMGAILSILGATGGMSRIRLMLSPARKAVFQRTVTIYIRMIALVAGASYLLSSWGGHQVSGVHDQAILFAHPLPSFLVVLILVVSQLPLTVVNGLLLAVDGTKFLFPDGPTLPDSDHSARTAQRKSRLWMVLSDNRIAVSLGLSNIAAGMVGAFPVCHGSGAFRTYHRLRIESLLPSLLSGAILLGTGGLIFFLGAGSIGLFSMTGFWAGILMILSVLEPLLSRSEKELVSGKDEKRTLLRGMSCVFGALPAILSLFGIDTMLLVSLSIPLVLTAGALLSGEGELFGKQVSAPWESGLVSPAMERIEIPLQAGASVHMEKAISAFSGPFTTDHRASQTGGIFPVQWTAEVFLELLFLFWIASSISGKAVGAGFYCLARGIPPGVSGPIVCVGPLSFALPSFFSFLRFFLISLSSLIIQTSAVINGIVPCNATWRPFFPFARFPLIKSQQPPVGLFAGILPGRICYGEIPWIFSSCSVASIHRPFDPTTLFRRDFS